ncbi:DUF3168 domain-containing protein [Kaistia sp. MMO-174]|uniref:DUF3168 domain-containing protein n=1 Tax=Kaistia sp. MMO-174 TaxID=3081256 RepID=UPI0030177568
MSDASLELQAAVVAALKSSPDVAAIVSSRIFDQVPSNATFPYISLGPDQVLSDGAECVDGLEISLQIDVWSRAVGFPETKRIAGAVRAALHLVDLDLPTAALLSLEHRQTRTLRDRDGITSHAVIEFTALVELP